MLVIIHFHGQINTKHFVGLVQFIAAHWAMKPMELLRVPWTQIQYLQGTFK